MTRHRQQRKSGAILIAVLVTLLVITTIASAAMVMSLRAYRECRTERQLIQAQFLCEAGYLRAVELIRKDPAFTGDQWTPSLGDGSESIAEITTSIQRDTNQPTIAVTATIGAKLYQHQVRRTKSYPIQIPAN